MQKEQMALIIMERLMIKYPETKSMLNYGSVFQLVLAVLLSAQSTDKQVNNTTAKLFKIYQTPRDFAKIEIDELEEMIKGVGIYRNKARNIKKLAAMLIENFDGEVPSDFDSLLQLPGIGRKSANVILAVGFQKPGLGVDTHVQRVANRIGLVNELQPVKTELGLKKILPAKMWGKAHQLLIYHGRNVCKARKPKCDECIIEDLCQQKVS